MDTLKKPSAIILRNFFSAFAVHFKLCAWRVFLQGNSWRKLKNLLILKTFVTFRLLHIFITEIKKLQDSIRHEAT